MKKNIQLQLNLFIASLVLLFASLRVSAQPLAIRLPSLAVQLATPLCPLVTDGSPASFIGINFAAFPPGYTVVSNFTYRAWCLDYFEPIDVGVHCHVLLYNSYDPALPARLQSPNWDMVNYILNHKQGTYIDVQAAIWTFIGGPVPGGDGIFYPPTVGGAGLAMINDALAHGEGFVPAGGQVVGIVIDFGVDIQPVVMEVTIPAQALTRSQGFWATHYAAMNYAVSRGCINLGLVRYGTTAQNLTAPTINQVEAIVWGQIGQRSALGQARMQLGQQLIAALANACVLGATPAGNGFSPTLLNDAVVALDGTDVAAIRRFIPLVTAFNESGDGRAFGPLVPSALLGNATPQQARTAAQAGAGLIPSFQ